MASYYRGGTRSSTINRASDIETTPMIPKGWGDNFDIGASEAGPPPRASKGEGGSEKKSERFKSLDAFRGLVIMVMILVDDGGGIYENIDHSPWDNITLADFVMPFFLFIVGVSLTYSLGKTKSTTSKWETTKKILVRAAKLFLLGLLLQGSNFPYQPECFNLATIRIPGILQRIAFAYLVVGLIETFVDAIEVSESPYAVFMMYPFHWLLFVITAAVYLGVMFGVNVPGCGRGQLNEWCNAPLYVDTLILTTNHMYCCPTYQRSSWCSSCTPGYCPRPDAPAWCNQAFDPEGIITTIATVMTALMGCHFGHTLQYYKTHRDRLMQWVPLSLVNLGLGLLVHYTFMPLNKNLWSFSYMFFMAGCAGLWLCGFYIFMEIYKLEMPMLPLVYMGMNSILIFTMAASDVLEGFISWFWVNEPQYTLIWVIQTYVFESWLPLRPAMFMYVILKIVFWFVVAWYLHRINYYWKI